MNPNTAVLIDGGFFMKRYPFLYSGFDKHDARTLAKNICTAAVKHIISGDEDFVPAAKLARREGIDFILDPLWNPVDSNLFEHIDGLKSTSPRPTRP